MHYPPFLGDYLLSNFIHPIYRLSRTTQGSPERTPVTNKTPPSQRSGATTLRTTDATFRTSLPTSLCGSYSLRSSRLLSCKRRVLIVLQTTYRGPIDARRPEDESLGRPKWALLVLRRPKGVLRRPKGVLRRPKGVLRRPKGVLIVQSRPQWVLLVMQKTCRRQA